MKGNNHMNAQIVDHIPCGFQTVAEYNHYADFMNKAIARIGDLTKGQHDQVTMLYNAIYKKSVPMLSTLLGTTIRGLPRLEAYTNIQT